MKKKKKMIKYLPKDLWVHIFLRLPAKTILRCLSVCKFWKLVIQHPSFINAHLQNQRQDLMLIRYIPEDDIESYHDDEDNNLARKTKPEVYSLHLDDERFSGYANYELPIVNPRGVHFRVVGSCNGIICITNDQDSICHQTYLWNPTIQKCIELPHPLFTFDKIGPFDHELGFGFDEKTNDYKVVRVVEPDDDDGSPLEVEIYSLSSGIWRKASHLALDLGVHIFERAFAERDCQVYLNGAVHWVLWNWKLNSYRERDYQVIAFLLGDEVFRCFELPANMKGDFFSMSKLRPVVFQGALSLIHYSDERCGLWVMNDYGASSSWSKQLDINLSKQVNRMIGIRAKVEFLIEIRGGLYSYDPGSTKGKQFNFLDERDLLRWKRFQEGHMEGYFYMPEYIHNYDPEAAPKELGIRSKTKDFFKYSFHHERYVESLVLLGSIQAPEMSQIESEVESERILEEGDAELLADNIRVKRVKNGM